MSASKASLWASPSDGRERDVRTVRSAGAALDSESIVRRAKKMPCPASSTTLFDTRTASPKSMPRPWLVVS